MTPLQRVDRDKVILVEGKDEVLLLEALLHDSFADAGPTMSLVAVGGRTRFRDSIQVVRSNAERNGVQLRALAIIRDADDDAGNAWRSITDAVLSSGLQPTRPTRRILGRPSQRGCLRNARRHIARGVGVPVPPLRCGSASRSMRRAVPHVPRQSR